jgi:endonuclease/exonuclease/phosphatase family metal-dependent hydrolase
MNILAIIGWVLLAIVIVLLVAALGYVIYMQAHYYRIPDHQKLLVQNQQHDELTAGKQYSAVTMNVGFGCYNQDFDFFMDVGELKDGTKLRGHRGKGISRQAVQDATDGAMNAVGAQDADFMIFQEIDTHSNRSYFINQVRQFEKHFTDYAHVFAYNFHSPYLIVPLNDPHGAVQSGLLSMSKYRMTSAERRQYPVSSAFIPKCVDLDRCFVAMRFPVDNGKTLLFINSHMSAYDKGGTIRDAQLKLLFSIMEAEYKKGNYVIVGGDFNHAFGKDMLGKLAHEEKVPAWINMFEQSMMPDGFTMVLADNRDSIGTDRSPDIPFDPKVNYQTVCDGFLVSANVEPHAHNIDTQFKYSDHNPVRLDFVLKA